MENLRAAIESDLHDSLEGEFGMAVELTSPNGVQQIYSKNNPSELLKGQVLYFSRREDPETGETIVIKINTEILKNSFKSPCYRVSRHHLNPN